MTPKLKKIIIIGILIAVAFIVYAIFFKADPTKDPLLNTGAGSPEAQAIGSQISQALLRIEQIKLDKSIFTSEIYKTLVDRSQPISEEPIGRSNPFAPLGDISVSSATKVTATSTATSTKPKTGTSTTPTIPN